MKRGSEIRQREQKGEKREGDTQKLTKCLLFRGKQPLLSQHKRNTKNKKDLGPIEVALSSILLIFVILLLFLSSLLKSCLFFLVVCFFLFSFSFLIFFFSFCFFVLIHVVHFLCIYISCSLPLYLLFLLLNCPFLASSSFSFSPSFSFILLLSIYYSNMTPPPPQKNTKHNFVLTEKTGPVLANFANPIFYGNI